MTANKSRLSLHEAAERENSLAEVETEEDSEEEETETMGSAEEVTEDPEEISVTDPKDVSTVARKAISPRTALNVHFLFNGSKKTKRIQQRQQT